ncbi:antitoxin ParD1/3/4 [Alteromonadaceae bacterium 2753L.S.0a.02]|nr:antitoxin ParD1/3/4 [Alteromonadaceae bacterium 2753L.S.0a.02]
MNVSLTSELENYVKAKVATGMYNSASEVMREALRLMEERDAMQAVRLEALRQDINKGLDSLEREGSKPLDMEAIKANGRARLAGNSNTDAGA